MFKKIVFFLFLFIVIVFSFLKIFNYYTFKKTPDNFKEGKADLNNNNFEELYILKNGSLNIKEDSKIIWQSPKDWLIDDFVLADSDNDGFLNINLSFWRVGSFGTSKPFWIKKNDKEFGNHFFVLSLNNQEVRQIWGSSRLANPNCEFKIIDVNDDGKNELVVLEGDYKDYVCQGKYLAVWEWNGWGFSNKWRSMEGDFSNLEIEKIDY